MKKVISTLLISILALTFCFGGVAYAQEDETLPDPGITPDSAFYFVDVWGEQLGLMFAFNVQDRAGKAMRYAEEKLAEMNAMLAQNKVEDATRATNQHHNRLMTALEAIEVADDGDATLETVALAAAKQIRYCNDSMAGAPVNAQGALTQARDTARTCEETALKCMAQGDPEEGAQLHLQLMERQLNGIQIIGEESEPVRLQNALQEFARLNALGEDILEVAEDKGKGAEVGQMYGMATANHLALLAKVHGQVQAQAQGAIEDSMQICVENHVEVVNRLSNNNMLGGITEEAPIPEELPENVRQKLAAGGSGQKP
ncbi:DUF5667 domain-containing protein [Chloroflexota bacterium]